MTEDKITPWYKEPMMLLVVGIPIIAILWGGVMLKLAISGADSLVSDSYYKDGVSYTENRERDQAADRLQAEADIIFSTNEIKLTLSGYFDKKPDTLQLQITHPTLEDRDKSVLMQLMPDGDYLGINELTLPEKRHLWLISPEQKWRLRGTEFVELNKAIHLSYK